MGGGGGELFFFFLQTQEGTGAGIFLWVETRGYGARINSAGGRVVYSV